MLAANAKLRAEIIPDSKKNKSNVSNAFLGFRAYQLSAFAQVGVEIEHCPRCGGNMKIIAAILERAAITKNLNHLD